MTYVLICWRCSSFETGWDIIDLVSYIVLMIYYYMPSFHMAWIEVWLYSPKKLIKLTDVFYLLKHKIKKSFLAGLYTLHSPHLCWCSYVCYLWKLVGFQSKRTRHRWKQWSRWSSLSGDSVTVSSKFWIQHNFKAASQDGQPHRLFWPGLQINLHFAITWRLHNKHYSQFSLDFTIISIISGSPGVAITPKQHKTV